MPLSNTQLADYMGEVALRLSALQATAEELKAEAIRRKVDRIEGLQYKVEVIPTTKTSINQDRIKQYISPNNLRKCWTYEQVPLVKITPRS